MDEKMLTLTLPEGQMQKLMDMAFNDGGNVAKGELMVCAMLMQECQMQFQKQVTPEPPDEGPDVPEPPKGKAKDAH